VGIVEYRYTRHQVARGARPDASDGGTWFLLKYVSELHLTYQIRLLTFAAAQSRARLFIRVPKRCRLSPPLSDFVKQHKASVRIQRVD
jgi:hypothetical protein